MGTLWVVLPLDDQMRSWLDEVEVSYPDKASRFPTGAEIKAALASLSAYDLEIFDNGQGARWQANITHKTGGEAGPWTSLNISNYSGDDLPQKLSFKNGWDSLITEILEQLTVACGPLVLIADSDGEPTVIGK